MPQVSRRFVKKDILDKIDNLLKEAITSCHNANETSEFLDDILTPTEKVMIAKRLSIAHLLLNNYPYETIKQVIKVSTPTIGSVSLSLKIKGNGYRKILKKIAGKKQWKELFNELADIIVEILGTGKGGNWKATRSYLYQRKMDKQSPL